MIDMIDGPAFEPESQIPRVFLNCVEVAIDIASTFSPRFGF